jgi:hypothetical protein
MPNGKPDEKIGMPTVSKEGAEVVTIAIKDEKGHWKNTEEHVAIPLMSHPFIGYRGDDRDPQVIFELGFSPRDASGVVFRAAVVKDSDDARFRRYEFEGAGDLTPANIVCVSSSLQAAALFPLPARQPSVVTPPDLKSYIYVIHVEKAWNTSYFQTLRAMTSWKLMQKDAKVSDDLKAAVGATLYGREHFCKQIAGPSIIGAIECVRSFTSWTYQQGGTFRLVKFIANQGCKSPLKALAVTAIDAELKHKVGPRPLPIPALGFHRSDPKALGPSAPAPVNLSAQSKAPAPPNLLGLPSAPLQPSASSAAVVSPTGDKIG